MTEGESMNVHPSGLPETHDSGEEAGNVDPMEKLDLYLSLTEDCTEAVQKMSARKFNDEQCGYLADKLGVVVQSARSFLQMLRAERFGPGSFVDIAKWVENFKLLLALANQIESFVQGCCKDAWIQAAMTLTNVSQYVSSIGFNLELCKISFCNDCAATGNFTLVEVGNINKAEVEIVEKKASVDVDILFRKVIKGLNSFCGDDRYLAGYLLQRLLRDEPNPTSDDESYLGKLFTWVISAEQLGRGASATVHKAMWLGTAVAKKTFHGSENPDFLKEVKILSQLCHPNITSMFCCAKNRRRCSIIMELMDGDLYTLMERRLEENMHSVPFSILEAVDIMLQVGDGVNYLHNKGIVHRDLKSSNILVQSVKSTKSKLEIGYVLAKVADFGISKANNRSTTYSNQTYNAGTCRWMPPEIMRLITCSQGSSLESDKTPKYPFKCDTYSFALVCYEILTGCVPFSTIHSLDAIRTMVMKGERPHLPNDCPSRLVTLIKKCWNQDPKERPTFADVCLELKYLKYLLMTDGMSIPTVNNLATASTGSISGEKAVFPSETLPSESIETVTSRSLDSLSHVAPSVDESNSLEIPELATEEAKSLFVRSSDCESRDGIDEAGPSDPIREPCCEPKHIPFDKPENGSKGGGGNNQVATSEDVFEVTKLMVSSLVGKLATGSPEVQKQAAYELRLLAKCGTDNRMCIAEAGAIPYLVTLLSSKDPKTQENAVTALLNLSIYDDNKTLIINTGALDPIIEVLRFGGSMESRENAAATLFSLSMVHEYKIIIGRRPAAIPGLVALLRDGTPQIGKKDAAFALFNLAVYHGNKSSIVESGAVTILVSLLSEEEGGIADDALMVLALVAGSTEGLTAIADASAIPILVRMLRVGTPKGRENAIAVLLALCRNGGERIISSVMQVSTAVPSLYSLLTMGTPRAKRKASSLLKLLHKRQPEHHPNPQEYPLRVCSFQADCNSAVA